jgi:hypothetical protein
VKRGSWTVKPGLIGPDEILLIGDNRELPEQSFFVVPRGAIVARWLCNVSRPFPHSSVGQRRRCGCGLTAER